MFQKMVVLPPSIPSFYVLWKDISEGIGNIFSQYFARDWTIVGLFFMRVIPYMVHICFLDTVFPRWLTLNFKNLKEVRPSTPINVQASSSNFV